MLRITIELVPSGNAAKKKTIRVMEISNLSDLSDVSDYAVVAVGEGAGTRRQGKVRGHQRLKWGPWRLVSNAIRALKLDLEDG